MSYNQGASRGSPSDSGSNVHHLWIRSADMNDEDAIRVEVRSAASVVVSDVLLKATQLLDFRSETNLSDSGVKPCHLELFAADDEGVVTRLNNRAIVPKNAGRVTFVAKVKPEYCKVGIRRERATPSPTRAIRHQSPPRHASPGSPRSPTSPGRQAYHSFSNRYYNPSEAPFAVVTHNAMQYNDDAVPTFRSPRLYSPTASHVARQRMTRQQSHSPSVTNTRILPNGRADLCGFKQQWNKPNVCLKCGRTREEHWTYDRSQKGAPHAAVRHRSATSRQATNQTPVQGRLPPQFDARCGGFLASLNDRSQCRRCGKDKLLHVDGTCGTPRRVDPTASPDVKTASRGTPSPARTPNKTPQPRNPRESQRRLPNTIRTMGWDDTPTETSFKRRSRSAGSRSAPRPGTPRLLTDRVSSPHHRPLLLHTSFDSRGHSKASIICYNKYTFIFNDHHPSTRTETSGFVSVWANVFHFLRVNNDVTTARRVCSEAQMQAQPFLERYMNDKLALTIERNVLKQQGPFAVEALVIAAQTQKPSIHLYRLLATICAVVSDTDRSSVANMSWEIIRGKLLHSNHQWFDRLVDLTPRSFTRDERSEFADLLRRVDINALPSEIDAFFAYCSSLLALTSAVQLAIRFLDGQSH